MADIANSLTGMVCGYRLHGPDLGHLERIAGSAVEIDLLMGYCRLAGEVMVPPLQIAGQCADWLREALAREAVSPGTLSAAIQTLEARSVFTGMEVACRTTLITSRGTFTSTGSVVWHRDDIDNA